MSDGLLERSEELASIATAIDRTRRDRGTCLTVDGGAGIGKTALLTVAAVRAREQEVTVRVAVASELERDAPFGVIRSLLSSEDDTAAPPVLRRGTPPVGPAGDQADAVAGVGRFVAELAARGPLALVVDDVHWADAASVRCLVAVARQRPFPPLALVVAGRESEQLRAVRRSDGVVALSLRPLSATGTAQLVRTLAPDADDDVCTACHAATGGSPLFVCEVARGLPSLGLGVTAGAAERIRGWSPARLTQTVGDRLDALPAAARQMAHALAVLGDGASLFEVTRLARIDPATGSAVGDALRGIGVLDAGSRLAFAHPVLRAAVRGTLPPGAADRLHRDAAALLREAGESPGRVAAQLLECAPAGDEAACRSLIAAADEAQRRRDPEVAARHLRRAWDEPAPTRLRVPILMQLGMAEAQAHEQDAAIGHLQRAIALASGPDERLDAALGLVSVLAYGAGDGAPVIRDLLDQLTAVEDREHVAEIQAHVALHGVFSTASRQATAALGSIVLERVERQGDGGSPAERTIAAIELAMAGRDASRVARLARAAMAMDGLEPARHGSMLMAASRCLAAADALDDADAGLRPRRDDDEDAGYYEQFVAFVRADVAWRRGDLERADRDATTVWRAACRHDWPMLRHAAGAVLAVVCLDRGDPKRGMEILDRAHGAERPELLPQHYTSIMLLAGRARWFAATGAEADAVADLRECRRRLEAFGEDNPALIDWRSPLALLVGGDDGRRLAADNVDRAAHFGAARSLGIAQRVAALLAVDPDEQVRGLRAAYATLEASPARLERARTAVDLGRRLADADPEAARATLLEAYEDAHRCDATVVKAAAGEVLRSLGVRPRRPFRRGPEALSARERAVCRLAAEGRTNRQIAEQLVVTVGTVEFHLSRAYRKLGVSSRSALTASLEDCDWDAPRTV